MSGLLQEISLARKCFGLSGNARVLSCYESGRDGFWLHRYLEAQGVGNLEVDSACVKVNRRFRRAKTDRMDVGKLLNMLIGYEQSEQKVWSVVSYPKEPN